MLKKVLFFALAITLVTVGFASAAQNVANTTQKGSLLIFPKIYTWPGLVDGPGAVVDTYVTIGNDYYTDVWVKCYWVNHLQEIQDFMFKLTPNQPVIFSAFFGTSLSDTMTVPPFWGKGELKCWAVNAAGDEQISFNHLYGMAILAQEDAGVTYNAWSFAAKATLGSSVGVAGDIKLTGAAGGYDACPQYLVANFVPSHFYNPLWDENVRPDLTLVPCKQDLRQDRTPTCTKAKFDIWNENETKYTGAYQCFKCWYEGFLDQIGGVLGADKSGFGGDKFCYGTLHTPIARFRVYSAPNAACAGAIGCPSTTVTTPFLGLMLYASQETVLLPNLSPVIPWAAYEPFTAGLDATGEILWDKAGTTPEAPKQ